ncbi:hypothetical protein NVV94_09465 [Pseudomonas sp. LS1212]|uniref:hypothetical protein n=1 Tax=Pseudomonas sp. LS1212 TaxID=2972478 RepID=UPI00215BD45A|nr:hypothetical protein [Pseudomonas sp. LS1212]UVJ45747.1 hypothetical protein NVV94_09465 [Pseudomonas sp. LS1212]
MPTNELISSLLFRLNENQLAIAAAVEQLAQWLDQRGHTEVADNVRETLTTLDANLEHITRGIAQLMND